jgi:predicted HicB family RNase H-like nuclease
MNTLSYNGYTAKIEFDPNDNIMFGNIVGIRDTVGFHGDTVAELSYFCSAYITRNKLGYL